MGEVLMRNQVGFARAIPEEGLCQREVTRKVQSHHNGVPHHVHSTVGPVKEHFTESICHPQREK